MADRTRERVGGGIREGLDPVRLLAGAVVSLALVGGLLALAGPGAVVRGLRRADPLPFALAGAAAVTGLALRSLAAARLYGAATGERVGVRFFVVYLSVVLPKNLLPAGYAAGPPMLAYALSRDTGDRFESALAPLAVAELLNLAVSLSLAAGGGVAVLVLSAPTPAAAARRAAGVTLVVGLVVSAALLARSPTAARSLSRARVAAGRALAGWPVVGRLWPVLSARIGGRGRTFVRTTGAVAEDRAAVAGALGLTAAAGAFAVAPLYLALESVGAPAAVPVILLAVPLSGMAGAVPLPGGIGGVEFALSGLLVAVGGVDPSLAAAATLVYRLATLGVITGVGAAAVGVLAATGAGPGVRPPRDGPDSEEV